MSASFNNHRSGIRGRGPRPSRPVAAIPPARRADVEERDPKKRNEARRQASAAPGPELTAGLPENVLAGRNPIREALRANRPVEKLMVQKGDLSGAALDIVRLARDAGAVVQHVDKARLDEVYPAHQGMIAFVAQVQYASLDDVLFSARERGEAPFIVLLDGITDPHNLGAILRTCECAGAHGAVIPERRACGLTPAVAKAAAGALSHLPVVRTGNLHRTIDQLKEAGLWVIGSAMDGEDAFGADLSGPIALVIGSEGEGIGRLTREKCDRIVTLPMLGHIESLNASVAAGILMYRVLEGRRP